MCLEVKTIFCDIDGIIVEHTGNMTQQMEHTPTLLPGAKDKFVEWERAGHKIILTTGRRESLRPITEKMLTELGIFYDQLVMGLPRGPRIVINDMKPDSPIQTAIGICLPRNKGLEGVTI